MILFLSLFAVTFGVATAIAFVVEKMTRPLVFHILSGISGDMAVSWQKLISLAMYTMAITWSASATRITYYLYETKNYDGTTNKVAFDKARAAMEIYESILDAMEGAMGILILFFIVTVIATAIMRGQQRRAAERVLADLKQ